MDRVLIGPPIITNNIEPLIADPTKDPFFVGERRQASHRDKIALVCCGRLYGGPGSTHYCRLPGQTDFIVTKTNEDKQAALEKIVRATKEIHKGREEGTVLESNLEKKSPTGITTGAQSVPCP